MSTKTVEGANGEERGGKSAECRVQTGARINEKDYEYNQKSLTRLLRFLFISG